MQQIIFSVISLKVQKKKKTRLVFGKTIAFIFFSHIFVLALFNSLRRRGQMIPEGGSVVHFMIYCHASAGRRAIEGEFVPCDRSCM